MIRSAPASANEVFFFQAEDGIRDLTVTGVQTCALPISNSRRRGWRILGSLGAPGRINAELRRGAGLVGRLVWVVGLGRRAPMVVLDLRKHLVMLPDRSEERRVGKECRARRSRYQ